MHNASPAGKDGAYFPGLIAGSSGSSTVLRFAKVVRYRFTFPAPDRPFSMLAMSGPAGPRPALPEVQPAPRATGPETPAGLSTHPTQAGLSWDGAEVVVTVHAVACLSYRLGVRFGSCMK